MKTKTNQLSQAFFAVSMFAAFIFIFTSADKLASPQHSFGLWMTSFLYLFLGFYSANKYITPPQLVRQNLPNLTPTPDFILPKKSNYQDQPVPRSPQVPFKTDTLNPWAETISPFKGPTWSSTPISPK